MGDEKQTGFYVGILTSTFALCQLLTGNVYIISIYVLLYICDLL